MAVDLISLVAKFLKNEDRETEGAFFRTKVPQVAPEAYLHTIYKPAERRLVEEVSSQLGLPASVVDFCHKWNGAHFFVNVLSVFGCVSEGPVNRADRFMIPPFDVLRSNRELSSKLAGTNLVALAAYSLDGSLVCVERNTQEILCFIGKNVACERVRWRSIDHWLENEVSRIAFLFDELGNRLVGKDQLLPRSGAAS